MDILQLQLDLLMLAGAFFTIPFNLSLKEAMNINNCNQYRQANQD
jgi:hypothetical protein